MALHTVEELRRRTAARDEAHEQHVGGQLVLRSVLGFETGQQVGQKLGDCLLFHLHASARDSPEKRHRHRALSKGLRAVHRYRVEHTALL